MVFSKCSLIISEIDILGGMMQRSKFNVKTLYLTEQAEEQVHVPLEAVREGFTACLHRRIFFFVKIKAVPHL